MALWTVTFSGTRVNNADSNTNWGNFVIGGGAPASEFPLAYQVSSGTTAGAVNKKITSTSARQGVDYVHGTGQNMTTAANKLWFVKVYVSDSFDLNTTWGVELAIGSADTNNDHRYNVAGSGANLTVYDQYPAQGGYLITSLDPEITAWREAVNGTPNWASVVWFAVGAQFVNGTAKAENVAMDAIDIGKGLVLTGGDGANPDGTFKSFVETDQNTKTNRWGVVTGSGDIVRANGILEIGNTGGTATAFTDTTSIVLYPDGYHSRGTVGVEVNLQSASTTIVEGATHIGEGTRNGVDANDTRPDYTVVGVTQSSNSFSHELRNFRDVTYTSVCNVANADIECHLLVQNSANISDTIIRCNALSSEACLQDPTFGTTTDLHDTTFIQAGAGHALELDTATDYTFTNLFFSGFNASNNQTDSAIDVTASSGTVNISVIGGDLPSYTTAGATVNVTAAVTVRIDGVAEGTAIKVIANETVGTVTKGDVIIEGFANSSGVLETTNFSYETAFEPSGLDVLIRARNQGISVSAQLDNGGTFTDETTEANSSTTSDMTIFPAFPAVGDHYYWGAEEPFDGIKIEMNTAVSGLTVVWEYRAVAVGWRNLTNEGLTNANGIFSTGIQKITWSKSPSTPFTTFTVNGVGPLYWVRARVTSVSTPVGGAARWCQLDKTRYLPIPPTGDLERTITSDGLTATLSQAVDSISSF